MEGLTQNPTRDQGQDASGTGTRALSEGKAVSWEGGFTTEGLTEGSPKGDSGRCREQANQAPSAAET